MASVRGRTAALAAIGLALALGACGGDDATPPPAAPAAAPAEHVRFLAADGKPVEGVFRRAGAAAPAVVLVNGLVGGRAQWDAFAPALHAAGFATLAYEGRGGVDPRGLLEEVAGALAFLRDGADVDPRRLGVVGSSIGASTAVLAMSGPLGRRLRAAVAISPQDVAALRGRRGSRAHDVLFLSDHREAATVRALARGAARSRVAESELLGHGVALLGSETNRRLVLDWLARLRTPGG